MIGHTRTDLSSQSVSFWPVGAYYIVYRPQQHPIEIVRILHGARDIPSILKLGYFIVPGASHVLAAGVIGT